MQTDEKFKAQAEAHTGRVVSLWGAWTDERPFHTGVLMEVGEYEKYADDGFCLLIDFEEDGPTICPVKDFDTITVHNNKEA